MKNCSRYRSIKIHASIPRTPGTKPEIKQSKAPPPRFFSFDENFADLFSSDKRIVYEERAAVEELVRGPVGDDETLDGWVGTIRPATGKKKKEEEHNAGLNV